MKKLWGFLAVGVLLLTGCTTRAVDATPVWQQTLPETGAEMTVSNCTLLSDESVYYAMSRDDTSDLWDEKPALQVEGIPVVTLQGVTSDQVELRFAENVDYLYLYYDKVMPQEGLDYIFTEQADGSLQYRLDTVYNYEFRITTEEGSNTILLICKRDDV